MENILSYYYYMKDNSELYPIKETISIAINNTLGEIRYTFPSSLEECMIIDHLWFCPTIFSLFHIEDFFRIFTAVLLERPIIFVSDNITILS